MASFAASFATRQRAAEGRHFTMESQIAVLRHLEKLVEQGKVDRAVLEAARHAQEEALSGLPTEVINRRAEYVFQHKPGVFPAPRVRDMRYMQLGTQISFGRARWTTDDASIFSVADGQRLASTPPKSATYAENVRMARIERAALETPTMAGYRLLPEFTPGRALMWGTILALWGTAGLVASTARGLDIGSAEEAPGRLRATMAPLVAGLEAWMAPLRGSLSITARAGDAVRQDAQQSELVRRLKATLVSE